jgi:antitoxin component YwqK of YwqJK toxin-antitoxin module
VIQKKTNPAGKEVIMKKLGFIFGFILLFSSVLLGQNIREVDGVYMTSGSKPYTGHYVTTYGNGNIKMEMQLTRGLKNGEMRIYFENGKLNEIRSYKKNVMDGTWTTYNENSIKVAVANYKKGLKHGEWKVWNDSGKLIYEMYYMNGKKSGVWKKYSIETGEVISVRTY